MGYPSEIITVIYFIQDTGNLNIKIGFTAGPAAGRVKELQTGNPSRLTVIASMPGTKETETKIHMQLASSRGQGEWFRPTPEVLRFLMKVNAMQSNQPDVGRALHDCLRSPNEEDSNGEAANVVDGLFEISRSLRYVAEAIYASAGVKSPACERKERHQALMQHLSRPTPATELLRPGQNETPE